MARTENIKTARITLGEKPVISAYIQSIKITMITACFRLIYLLKSLKKPRNIGKIIPTCKPETAKACIAPVAVKAFLISASKKDLSPSINAVPIANSSPSK